MQCGSKVLLYSGGLLFNPLRSWFMQRSDVLMESYEKKETKNLQYIARSCLVMTQDSE